MSRQRKMSVNYFLQRRLAEILMKDSKDPRFQRLTISRVETASDLTFAKIYVSMYQVDAIEDLEKSLNKAAGFFSVSLGKVLKTRNTPRLQFVYDRGFDHASHIHDLLRKAAPFPSSEEVSEENSDFLGDEA